MTSSGLKVRDFITDVGKYAVSNAGFISRELRRSESRDVEIKIVRDGNAMTLNATLESPAKSKSRVIF